MSGIQQSLGSTKLSQVAMHARTSAKDHLFLAQIYNRICRRMCRLNEPPLLVFVWLCHSHSASLGGSKRVAEATPAVAAMPYSHPPTCDAFHGFSSADVD